MPTKANAAAANEAKHGEKMIEVKIRFWTDNIAGEKNKVIPKHAWTSGVVRVERNDAHGISPTRGVPFNSLLDVGVAVEKALVAHGIKLHASRKMRKYLKVE